MAEKVKVLIIESEKDWGSKVEDVIEFDTLAEATQYVKDYNDKYNPPMEQTPDWYMIAMLESDYGIARYN